MTDKPLKAGCSMKKAKSLHSKSDRLYFKNLQNIPYDEREEWKKFFDGIHYPIIIFNPQYEVMSINEAASKLLKQTTEDIFGSKCYELFHGMCRAASGCPMDKLLTEGYADTFEMEIETVDGTYLVSCVPILNDSGKIVQIIHMAIDITKRKMAEKALKTSEDRYRSIFENSVEGIFQTTIEGRFLSVNLSLARLFGYASPQEFMELITNIEEQHYSDKKDRDIFKKTIQKEGFINNFEAQLHKKDGASIWVSINARTVRDEKGSALYYEGTMIDITRRKAAEDALKKSERHLSNIIEFLPDATFAIDRDGCVIVWNKAIEEMTGYSADMMIGKGDYEYSIPFYGTRRPILVDFLSIWRDDIEKKYSFIKRDGDTLYTETDAPRVRGQSRILWAKASPLRDENGIVTGAIESIRDITDHKRLESQFLQAQKMESVGRLAGGIAHDFNNMLSIILGNAEMALDQLDKLHPVGQKITHIKNAAERSADLTRQLLAFASQQTVAPKVIDLNDAVKGALNMIKRLIGEDIDLVWIPCSDLWPVKIDPSQVDHILTNLCINARDAIMGAGRIIIETQCVFLDETYRTSHPDFIPGDYVLLSISDNGRGIGNDVLNKLFDPFYTTKEIGKGTGLGLAMVYGIVKQNSGFINVYSEPGCGTTFKIYLLRHMGNEYQLHKNVAMEQTASGYETVLLVEDDPAILEMIAMMLREMGYKVLGAGSPGEAKKLAEKHTGDVHLLLTDVIMPEMNGRELARRLLPLFPNIKCLFMSSYTANVIEHHGILDSGVNFIQKPFSMKELTMKLRKILNGV